MAHRDYERIYAVVQRIPRGRVATYGQVAALAGRPGQPRQVGYALHALQDDDVPWHRVLNARGEVSRRADPGAEMLQRALLEKEGVRFDARGKLDLARWRWTPRRAGAVRQAGRSTRASRPRTGPARCRGTSHR